MTENGAIKVKKTKNQIRRERAKAKKAGVNGASTQKESNPDVVQPTDIADSLSEFVGSEGRMFDTEVDRMLDDDRFAEYKQILNRFYSDEVIKEDPNELAQIFYSDDEDAQADSSSEDEKKPRLTRKQQRELNKIPLAELKARTKHPDVVEWFDADATDPELVVQLKCVRGVVPVPDHWQNKREYLSSKRGVLKHPFELPDFIKQTGIMEMRDALKEDDQTLRQKTRERVQPKMGRLDIDYQKLHDAFFQLQTKPRLFRIGEVYYEGKETEKDYTHYRPGKLSHRLKDALNIPPGAPPPWLLNMQRYGPPPSYPGLRIPGLNAPIPAGCQWGFQPGGWGRPPVDDKGVPIYGDVYGLVQQEKTRVMGNPIERQPWGQMEDEVEEGEEEEEEERDEEQEDQEEEQDEGQGYVDEESALAAEQREETVRSTVPISSEGIELRKRNRPQEDDEDEDREPKQLYHVLEQKETGESGFLGKQRGYEIPPTGRRRRRFEESVDVSLDPDELQGGGADIDVLSRRLDEERQRDKRGFQEDLNELLASEKKKRR
jgi:splicing factor 3B subunit 2